MLRIGQIEPKNSLLCDESHNNTSKHVKKSWIRSIHVYDRAVSKFNTYYLEIEISPLRRRDDGRESGSPSIADKLVEI